MLKMLILVCSSNLSPADCQLETALDIIHGPQVASVFECGMASQALAARTTILRRAQGEYMKVKCSPFREVAEAAPKLSPTTLSQH
jgi:hypothetical protein